jgi:hypothetical protein
LSPDQLDFELSDAQQSAVARAVGTLVPADEAAFRSALAQRLRGETMGDGSVARAVRELLAAGVYRRRVTAPSTSTGRPSDPGRSKLIAYGKRA